jgi:tRNA-dihydrouridine synthase A
VSIASLASRVAVAPMMDWTDRHCRYFFRLLSKDIRLYTEMVTAQAVLQGDRGRLLDYDPAEHPLALQLGGSEPEQLAEAARIANAWGYDEINLNIGCPSDRVQSGRFGACLMAEPERVAECVAAMCDAGKLPVTVKTRIGIDDQDDYEFLERFVALARAAGCRHFVVHARKAILAGLSPKENRSIPPLRYEVVYRLKKDFPELTVVLNGGVETIEAVREHLDHVDGVMIGRKAYADPWFLAELGGHDNSGAGHTREQVVEQMAAYAGRQIAAGGRLHHVTRHMLGLFNGRPGARRWRRYLSEQAIRPDADEQVLRDSLSVFDRAA